jgi:hypothetical protein
VKLSQVIPKLLHLSFGGYAGFFKLAMVLEVELDKLLFQEGGFIPPFLQFSVVLR